MSVTFYGRQKPTTAPDFTLVTLPDTQFYSQTTTYAATFTAQTNWIFGDPLLQHRVVVPRSVEIESRLDIFPAGVLDRVAFVNSECCRLAVGRIGVNRADQKPNTPRTPTTRNV